MNGSTVAGVLLATAALLAGLVPIPGAAAVGESPAAAIAGTPLASSFAARAGYSPLYAVETHDIRPAAGPLTVDVVFTPRSNSTANLPASRSTPPLTVPQFAERYGLDPAAFAAAGSYFASRGIEVVPFGSDRLGLELVGPGPALGAAFATTLVAGTYDGRPVVFPLSPPSLPSYLEDEVAGVVGLSSGFDTFSFALEPGPAGGATAPALSPGLITPARARAIYGYSQLYNLTGGPQFATGHAVAVVLWGPGYAPSDLATFFSQDYPSTFPAPNVQAYPVNGAPAPGPGALTSNDTRAAEELTLDIEWAASMAPGATIDAVYTHDGPPPTYGPSTANLTTALEEAISLRDTTNLTAISMSFGSPEQNDSSLVAAWSPLFSEADQLGITLLGATGDTGGDVTPCSVAPDPSAARQPEYPSVAPDVIAVGGTNVTILGGSGGSTTFQEHAWVNGGGGFSVREPVPSWQLQGSAAAPIAANGHRGFPDVSAAANDDFLFFDGSASSAGGTSFATPMWAGLVADVDAKWGHRLGFFTDRLYHVGASEPNGSIGAGLADVAGGANCVASAVAGWDAATGWGSPRAAVLYADLLGSFVNLTFDLRPDPVAPGGTLSVRVDLANRTSGRPIAGVPVLLTLSADVPFGPCTGTFDSVRPTTDANGTVSETLAVPWCYLGTHAVLEAQVTTVSYYGTNSTRVGVNLLGWFPQLGFLATPPWNYVAYGAIMAAAIGTGVGLGRFVGPAAGPPPVAGPPAPGPPAPASPPGPSSGAASPVPPTEPASSPREESPPAPRAPDGPETAPAGPTTDPAAERQTT